MCITERFRRLGWIRLHKTRIRMWQVHHQKVDLAFNPTDDGKRLAEVSLSMSWWVRQRHKHLPLALLGGENVILHDRDAAFKAMLNMQSFKYPLRRVPLLLWNQFVRLEDLIDNPGKTIQLRAPDHFVAPVTRRDRKHQHLLNSATVDPENTRRFPTAHAINKNSVTNAPIQIHVLQSRPPSKRRA